MLAAFLLPLLAQAGSAAAIPPDAAPPVSLEQARLDACLQEANTAPTTAIATASKWYGEAQDAERSFPQQCLGIAYTRLLRWKAAEDAFLASRGAMLEMNGAQRARLAAMAGNAALAEGRNEDALADFALGLGDAQAAGESTVAGEIEIDRSRALVALGQPGEAGAVLENARRDAPQAADGWLLSATLSRRQGDLATAQAQIRTAAGLAPADPAIGLEAGVIAVLSGEDAAARKSWQSVLATAPDSAEAATAKDYLAQLGDPPAAPADAPNPPEEAPAR